MERNAYYIRACLRYLEILGVEISGDRAEVVTHTYDSEAQKYGAWCTESVYAGLVAFNKGDHVMALRCSLQAADYVGRLRGFWPTPSIGDGFLALRNALEDALDAYRSLRNACACAD